MLRSFKTFLFATALGVLAHLSLASNASADSKLDALMKETYNYNTETHTKLLDYLLLKSYSERGKNRVDEFFKLGPREKTGEKKIEAFMSVSEKTLRDALLSQPLEGPYEVTLQEIEDTYKAPLNQDNLYPTTLTPKIKIVVGVSSQDIPAGYVKGKKRICNFVQGACQGDYRDHIRNTAVLPEEAASLAELTQDNSQSPPIRFTHPTSTLKGDKVPGHAYARIFPPASPEASSPQAEEPQAAAGGNLENTTLTPQEQAEKQKQIKRAVLEKEGAQFTKKIQEISFTEAQQKHFDAFDPDIDIFIDPNLFPERQSMSMAQKIEKAQSFFPQLFEKGKLTQKILTGSFMTYSDLNVIDQILSGRVYPHHLGTHGTLATAFRPKPFMEYVEANFDNFEIPKLRNKLVAELLEHKSKDLTEEVQKAFIVYFKENKYAPSIIFNDILVFLRAEKAAKAKEEAENAGKIDALNKGSEKIDDPLSENANMLRKTLRNYFMPPLIEPELIKPEGTNQLTDEEKNTNNEKLSQAFEKARKTDWYGRILSCFRTYLEDRMDFVRKNKLMYIKEAYALDLLGQVYEDEIKTHIKDIILRPTPGLSFITSLENPQVSMIIPCFSPSFAIKSLGRDNAHENLRRQFQGLEAVISEQYKAMGQLGALASRARKEGKYDLTAQIAQRTKEFRAHLDIPQIFALFEKEDFRSIFDPKGIFRGKDEEFKSSVAQDAAKFVCENLEKPQQFDEIGIHLTHLGGGVFAASDAPREKGFVEVIKALEDFKEALEEAQRKANEIQSAMGGVRIPVTIYIHAYDSSTAELTKKMFQRNDELSKHVFELIDRDSYFKPAPKAPEAPEPQALTKASLKPEETTQPN